MRRSRVIALALAIGLASQAARANLSHASPAGLLGLGVVALVVLLSPPVLAAITARKGERWRDLGLAVGVWFMLNAASCSVPTGQYGGASDMIRWQRFKAITIAFAIAIVGVRIWQYFRRRQATRAAVQRTDGDG